MARSSKYGRVTVEIEPEGQPLGDDEPVFLLRAQDALATSTILDYADRCRAGGAPKSHVDSALAQYRAFEQWQREHRAKVPD